MDNEGKAIMYRADSNEYQPTLPIETTKSRNLYAAVLGQALHDLRRAHCPVAKLGKFWPTLAHHGVNALVWFKGEGVGVPITFEMACNALELEPAATLLKIREMGLLEDLEVPVPEKKVHFRTKAYAIVQ